MVASGAAATQRRCAYTSSHRNCRQSQEIASARQFAFARPALQGHLVAERTDGSGARQRAEGPPLQD